MRDTNDHLFDRGLVDQKYEVTAGNRPCVVVNFEKSLGITFLLFSFHILRLFIRASSARAKFCFNPTRKNIHVNKTGSSMIHFARPTFFPEIGRMDMCGNNVTTGHDCMRVDQ